MTFRHKVLVSGGLAAGAVISLLTRCGPGVSPIDKPAAPEVYALGNCYAETDERDDQSEAGQNECDAAWENAAVSGGSTSLDRRTGLMWSRDSEAGDFSSEKDGVQDGIVNWFEAVGEATAGGSSNCTNADQTDCNTDGETFCGKLNAISYGGYTDWRAPGQKELLQAYVDGALHHADVFDPAEEYWMNTTESDASGFGYYADFGENFVAAWHYAMGSFARKNDATFARAICVRLGFTPRIPELHGCIASSNDVDDFVAAGNSECDSAWEVETLSGEVVAKDTRTKLMWSRFSQAGDLASEKDGTGDGIINWFEANGITDATSNPDGEGYCQILNAAAHAGFTDWRAPGHKEAMQAYIDGATHVDPALFPTDGNSWIWTRALKSNDTAYGVLLRFGYGNMDAWDKTQGWAKGACVRKYD